MKNRILKIIVCMIIFIVTISVIQFQLYDRYIDVYYTIDSMLAGLFLGELIFKFVMWLFPDNDNSNDEETK